MFETKNGVKIGLGGWLSVWLVLNCLGLIRMVCHINLHMLSDDDSKILTDPDSQYYHPLFQPLLYFEFFFQFFNPISIIFLIVLYTLKKRIFPTWVIIIYASNLLLVLFDAVSTMFIGKSVKLDTDFPWREFIHSMIGVCVWIPYFLKSKRVKATFVK
jgi:hypothetical protein